MTLFCRIPISDWNGQYDPSVDESSATRKTQMLATAAGEQMKACYFYKEMDLKQFLSVRLRVSLA